MYIYTDTLYYLPLNLSVHIIIIGRREIERSWVKYRYWQTGKPQTINPAVAQLAKFVLANTILSLCWYYYGGNYQVITPPRSDEDDLKYIHSGHPPFIIVIPISLLIGKFFQICRRQRALTEYEADLR